MAKGQILKDEITEKILKTFPDAFVMDKSIYINGRENGEFVQVKLALTTPKTPVEAPTTVDIGADFDWGSDDTKPAAAKPAPVQRVTEITQSERDNIAELMRKLNL